MKVYPVFLPLKGCPFRCIYCDQYLITGTNHFSLDEHLDDIANFCKKNFDKVKEIAFFGGTFTALDLGWQEEQFKKLASFIDDKTGIRYSTRPDCLTQDDINLAKQYGVRTIELGIQDFNNKVLQASRRGYNQAKAISACKLIKENNLNLGIQIMPGLPGFSAESLEEVKKITSELKPEFVRIYPTLVLKATKLEDLYRAGQYQALSLEEAIEISADLFQYFQEYDIKVIKMGVQIDSLDDQAIIAGPYHKAFGELVGSHLLVKKIIKDLQINPTRNEIILTKKDLSKLKGHKEYGFKLLEKQIPNKLLKLTIDNHSNSFIISIKTK